MRQRSRIQYFAAFPLVVGLTVVACTAESPSAAAVATPTAFGTATPTPQPMVQPTASSVPGGPPPSVTPPGPALAPASTTTRFESSGFPVRFDYPSNWNRLGGSPDRVSIVNYALGSPGVLTESIPGGLAIEVVGRGPLAAGETLDAFLDRYGSGAAVLSREPATVIGGPGLKIVVRYDGEAALYYGVARGEVVQILVRGLPSPNSAGVDTIFATMTPN